MGEPRFQPWRVVWRLPLFLLHVVIGIPVTLLCFIPGLAKIPAAGMTLKQRAHQLWKRLFLRIFGIRLKISGQLPDGSCLVVANHITWLDIVMLHALWPMWLVAKAEIQHWPLVGTLASLAGTIFIERGSSESRRRVARRMTALLRRGDRVGIFPEGGIREEPGVKQFHAPLFGAAIRAHVPVVPIAIRYDRGGDLHPIVVFAPGQNLLMNLLRVMAEAPMDGCLIIGQPLTDFDRGRRALARHAHEIVRQAYEG